MFLSLTCHATANNVFLFCLRRNRTVLNEAYAFERRQNSKQTKSSSSKNRSRVPAGFEIQTRAGSGFKKVSSGRVKFFGSGRVPGFWKTRATPTRDGYGIFHSFALCKKYGTFALGRAKNWYRKRARYARLENGLKWHRKKGLKMVE